MNIKELDENNKRRANGIGLLIYGWGCIYLLSNLKFGLFGPLIGTIIWVAGFITTIILLVMGLNKLSK